MWTKAVTSSERSARNTFVAPELDRYALLREQNQRLAELQQGDAESVELILNADAMIALNSDGALVLQPCHLTPQWHERRWFLGRIALSTDVDKSDSNAPQFRHFFARVMDNTDTSDFRWGDLRAASAQMPALDAALGAYARGLQLWHQRHIFCGVCGHLTVIAHAGHRRSCTNPSCATDHFPRTDPAVIMAVQFEGKILLGRQASWPEKRYSTLAGFVEPGESLEDAVRREVFEEAGVQVGRIDYFSSQPWPFPASLMLSFQAEAISEQLNLGDELQHARWFAPDEFEQALRTDTLRIPPSVSVSYRLIEAWF